MPCLEGFRDIKPLVSSARFTEEIDSRMGDIE